MKTPKPIEVIYSLPYLAAWIFLIIYICIFRWSYIKTILYKYVIDKEDVKNDVNNFIYKYIVVMEKMKPHIIGVSWILILLLIFK